MIFDTIKKRCIVGDMVSFTTVLGELFSGEITEIDDSTIVIKNANGDEEFILGEDIKTFKKIKKETIPLINLEADNPIDSPASTVTTHDMANNSPTDLTENEQSITTSDAIVSVQSDDNTSDSKPSVFKVGDVLDTLRKIDPTIDTKRRIQNTMPPAAKKKKNQAKVIGNDFSALAHLSKAEHDLENLKYVPALGEVTSYFPDRMFGFIYDGQSRKTIYFNASQIIDDSANLLSKGVPLIYTMTQSPQGPRAISIHKPGTIAEILTVAEKLYDENEYKKALEVVEHILTDYPDNFDADMLKRKIIPNIPFYQLNKTKEYFDVYAKAKMYHNQKNFEKAIEYYRKAIDMGHKVESAVKDLAMLYASLYKSTSDETARNNYRGCAIALMEEQLTSLPSNISSLYFLENFYYSIAEYTKSAQTISQLLEKREVMKDKTKSSILLVKLAASYMREHDYDRALGAIDEALSINPNNLSALKLKALIENPNGDDIETVISSADFDILTIGLSKFIEDTLNEYDEFFGVPSKIIESGEYTETTLKNLRVLIDKVGRGGRSRERARYQLTEAKLMTIVEDNNPIGLRSALSRYCISMAINHIYDNSPMDVIRFFYNESFTLDQNWQTTSQQVTNYLLTSCYTYLDLINATTKSLSVDDGLRLCLNGDFDIRKWDIILSMLLHNPEISAQITSRLYANTDYRNKAIRALIYWGIKNITTNISKDDFANSWNTARDVRLREHKQILSYIKSITENTDIEECAYRLSELRAHKKDWMTSLDTSRLYSILEGIVPSLETYIKSSGYRNKESNFNNVNGLLQQLIDDIKEGPTSLSYDAFLPLLTYTQESLISSFQDVIKMSEPRLSLELLSSETVVNDNNIVSLQISVKNHKDSSPIRETSVSVLSTDDIAFIEKESNLSYNAIEGGEERIFKLSIHISETVRKNKATALATVCRYKSGNEEKEYTKQLSLKLYSQDEYAPINNPYAAVADGGPVPVASKMFYGRESFIADICDSIIKSPSKQVIIYGQKRCGKSSVMLHLKDKLQKTGKAFCVFFSLGEIVNNLTEAAFYYKILSTIQQELENLEFEGEINLPIMEFPTYAAFKGEDEDNPLNTFSKYMIKFKQACKKNENWKEKNLVVMIDEFTYLYTEIKRKKISPSIMKQWKAVTQNEKAQFSVILVGQDVVPSFKKEDYARNAFGVIQDVRLTYLQEEPARELIENPILNENGESRYVGNAVSRIIEYTSRNPYYIQIFCARLVEYMNRNKSIMVTEADVNDVARSFIKGDQALEEDKFDNLIRAGETEDLQEYPEKDILAILHAIAVGTKNISYCNRSDINVFNDSDKGREDAILKHLEDREVIEKLNDSYKIQVKLFQEWLLNH